MENPAALKSMPAGAMVELGIGQIDEGKLLKQINRAIQDGHLELHRFKEDTGTNGKVGITIKIELAPVKDMADHVAIVHAVEVKKPRRTNKCFVKSTGDKLLCQPTGASKDEPEQQRLFDGKGRPLGIYDDTRGFSPEPETAGKIGGA